MNEQKSWTPEEIARLKALFREGSARGALAQALQRSVGSVRAKIMALGLRRGVRPWSDAEIDHLRDLHAQNLTIAEIAERLERSLDAVTTMCHRQELRRNTNALPWTEADLDRLQAMLAQGLNLAAIAAAIGHPRSSVADKLRQLKLTSSHFRQPWTVEELRLMDTFHAAGLGAAAIAERLPGRTPHAVRLKLEKRLRQQAIVVAADVVCPVSVSPGSVKAVAPLRLIGAAPVQLPHPQIPASVGEMERWLQTRDYVVLHRENGWIVDRHFLKDEEALLEFVNARRQRLGLPLFVRHGGSPARAVAVTATAAPSHHWRRSSVHRIRVSA